MRSHIHDEFVHVVQCYSINCGKRNHKYCVSRAKLFTSGDDLLLLSEIIQTILLNSENLD